MDLSTFLVILALIGINAIYVAAEFAAVSVRRSRIQQEADEGNPLARRLVPILNDPVQLDHYIAACQIGITLSSLILGAYGQAALGFKLAPFFENVFGIQDIAAQSASAIVILITLTATQMILGELVPKSLALEFPTETSLWTVIPMQWSLHLYSSFIFILNGSGHKILRLFGMQDVKHQHIHSPEEISLLIAESRDGGFLEPDEHRRLSQALALGVKKVSDIMVPKSRIQALNVDAPLDEVIRTFTDKPFTRLPVYSKDINNIVGIVHARDVALSTISANKNFSLRDILLPDLKVSATLTADELLVRMRERKRQLATVVNPSGQTIGLVGIADVLDEFLGDVVERGRGTEPQPERLSDGRVRIPAAFLIKDLKPWIGVEWIGHAKTVAGKLIEDLGYIPAPGERVLIAGVEVEIERASRRLVESIIVKPASSEKRGM